MRFQIIIPIFIISQGTIWKSVLFRGVLYKKLIRWSLAGELQKCVNVIQITHSTMIFARNKLHFQQLMILSSRFRCTLSAWYWCQELRKNNWENAYFAWFLQYHQIYALGTYAVSQFTETYLTANLSTIKIQHSQVECLKMLYFG